MACHHLLNLIAIGASLSFFALAELEDHHHMICCMHRVLISFNIELVKLIGEGLNLADAITLHYTIETYSHEVMNALLKIDMANVNCLTDPAKKLLSISPSRWLT